MQCFKPTVIETTLLNHTLTRVHGKHIAVIENEKIILILKLVV
uniref:Putative GTP-binding protein YjiA n=1 Tax=Rhizophora mucronata TaxID=61149 RepID=A0A2P2M1N6_RHIMU